MNVKIKAKDKEELNKAILQYLSANGYHETEEFFRLDAGLEGAEEPTKKNILELKWISVGRL